MSRSETSHQYWNKLLRLFHKFVFSCEKIEYVKYEQFLVLNDISANFLIVYSARDSQ